MFCEEILKICDREGESNRRYYAIKCNIVMLNTVKVDINLLYSFAVWVKRDVTYGWRVPSKHELG
jgi:hypothetical protein